MNGEARLDRDRATTGRDGVLPRVEDGLMLALRRLQGRPRLLRAAITLATASMALAIDWVTGPDTSAMFEYAIAAAVAAWLCGVYLAAGIVIGMLVVSTALMVGVDDGVPTWQMWVNASLRAATLLLIMVVVGALRRYIDRAEFVAHVDPLTGAWSRGALLDSLEHLVHHAHRTGAPLSVLFLDLDRLKLVNDTQGHAAGDAVIRRFARVVTSHVRRSDLFGRVGGDEFLVICPATDRTAAQRLADRILGDPDLPDVSIGVAGLSRNQTPSQLLVEADEAMYRAKQR